MAKNRQAPKFHSDLPILEPEERSIYRERLIRASENPTGQIQMNSNQSRPKYYQLALTPQMREKLSKVSWYNRRSIQDLIMSILMPAIDDLYREIPEEMR